MEAEDIARLGREAFARGLTRPKKDHKEKACAVLGFDTEYHSRTHQLVSWQLAGESGSRFVPAVGAGATQLTPETLWSACSTEAGAVKDVVLVTYFSLAELQHLPVFERATGLREFARGSLDCTFALTGGRRVHVFDVARFFDRSGLREAARAFGLVKLEYDTTRVTLRSVRDPAFRKYAVNDAEITRAIFVALRAVYLKDGVDILRARTPASAAAGVFKRKYLREDQEAPDARVRGLALRCCWGGRAEAFARKSWPQLHEYDLESAYPSAACALGKMPRPSDWRPVLSLATLHRWIGGFLRVTFAFAPGERYPCLPVAAAGSLLYPLRGESFCTIAEVRLAQRMGARLELLDGFAYADGATDLADMMRDVRRERATAEGARRVALKLSMNSLIGKFIQHRTQPGPADIERLAKELGVTMTQFLGFSRAELEALGLESRFRIGGLWAPEYNGLVTGLVRAQISELARDTSAVYCATDAVWTAAPLAKLPPGLALKREGPGLVARTRLGAIWPQHVVHHAWSNRKAAEAALRNAGGPTLRPYTFRRPLHFAEALRRESPVGRWIEENRCGSLGWDGKRQLQPDGSSRPWPNLATYRAARDAAKSAR